MVAPCDPQEIEWLKAEVAALRAAFATLVAGLHGRVQVGSLDDWRGRVTADFAAALAGAEGRGPLFAQGYEKIRALVTSASEPGNGGTK